jgi:hypothetical protein
VKDRHHHAHILRGVRTGRPRAKGLRGRGLGWRDSELFAGDARRAVEDRNHL